MENKISAIKFDMGMLPVDNPYKKDVIEVDEILFPGQFMIRNKGHRRSLEILLGKAVNDEKSSRIFTIDHSFAYWRPKMDSDGEISDRMMSLTRKVPYVSKGTNALGMEMYFHDNYNTTAPAAYFFNGQTMIGKIPSHGKSKGLVLYPSKIQRHFEFYSLDKQGDVHSTGVNLKYIASKDKIKLTVLYDENTIVSLDTDGNYRIKTPGVLRAKTVKNGNLLSEKDSTLYLNKEIPIRIYAESK